MKVNHIFSLILIACASLSCTQPKEAGTENRNLERAQIILDSLYQNYSAPDTPLLYENYPFDDKYTATYLASEEQNNLPNKYSYLWPFSGTFSSVNVLMEATKGDKYHDILKQKVLPGLDEYFDTKRMPYAYASYINTAPESDRFYDDNVWLGIDYTDVYMMTKNQEYLDKAKLIWKFILSGTDDNLGGGIYWCEQKKESKNTCSNAPGSVYAFKLFEATGDSTYFHQGKQLYDWTKANLQDKEDHLYYDNIRLDGKIGKAKFAYNSGQMIQSAALQYKLTKDSTYLVEAQNIAKSCYDYFFCDFKGKEGETFRMIKKGDVWFTAVMLRGFIELYNLDKNKTYLEAFDKSLDYAWNHSKDENGLFSVDFSGEKVDKKKWLLTQAAMVEMFGRLAMLEV